MGRFLDRFRKKRETSSQNDPVLVDPQAQNDQVAEITAMMLRTRAKHSDVSLRSQSSLGSDDSEYQDTIEEAKKYFAEEYKVNIEDVSFKIEPRNGVDVYYLKVRLPESKKFESMLEDRFTANGKVKKYYTYEQLLVSGKALGVSAYMRDKLVLPLSEGRDSNCTYSLELNEQGNYDFKSSNIFLDSEQADIEETTIATYTSEKLVELYEKERADNQQAIDEVTAEIQRKTPERDKKSIGLTDVLVGSSEALAAVEPEKDDDIWMDAKTVAILRKHAAVGSGKNRLSVVRLSQNVGPEQEGDDIWMTRETFAELSKKVAAKEDTYFFPDAPATPSGENGREKRREAKLEKRGASTNVLNGVASSAELKEAGQSAVLY